MFESLTGPAREPRRIAQPMLSFAIHVSLIALAIGQGTRPAGNIVDPGVDPGVIYIADSRGTTGQVESGTDDPLPRPACDCTIVVPGPIGIDLPGSGTDSIPGLPVAIPGTIPGTTIVSPGLPGTVGIYLDGDLSDSPVVRYFPDPVYPPALRAAQVEGAVQVTYVVDALGGVEPGSITIVSSDHLSMAAAVRSALLQARFQPGKVRGTPVRSLVRQTIRFSLIPL